MRPEYAEPVPRIDDAEMMKGVRTLSLVSLVRIKLTSYRDKDRTHLRDMPDVGLIDQSWVSRLPPEMQPRLQQLIDTRMGKASAN